MIDAFGLKIFQGGEIGGRGGLGFVQGFAGDFLEVVPAIPLKRGGVRDLAEETAPFDDDAVNVAGAAEDADPAMFVERVFVDGLDDLFRAGAVFGRNAVFEVTRDALQSVLLVAGIGHPTAPTIVVTRKAEAGVEVGEVVNEFAERVGTVFE